MYHVTLDGRGADVKGNTVEANCGKKRCKSCYISHTSSFIWTLINIAACDAMISKSFVVPSGEGSEDCNYSFEDSKI
jgi:hypothetical protein